MTPSCGDERVCSPLDITEDSNLSGFRLFSASASSKDLFFRDDKCSVAISPTDSIQGMPLWHLKKGQEVFACLSENADLFYQFSYVLGNPQPYNLSTLKRSIP